MAFLKILYEPDYFLIVVVSVLCVDVSDIFEADVSVDAGGATVNESVVVTVVESEDFVSVVALSLQAAKAPIAKTNKIFFMLFFLLL